MTVLVDTGPLYALINHREFYHEWAKREAARLTFPLHTCEAVISEAHFLLGRTHLGGRELNGMVEASLLDLSFSYAEHAERVNELMRSYESVPMSFADACLVCLAEIHGGSRIFTVDARFRIYRKHRNRRIDVLMP